LLHEADTAIRIAIEIPAMTGLSEFVVKLVGTGASVIAIAILWNLIRQIFFKNHHEPPVVFHWLPIIGSTVTYGIDPLRFFARCQGKVLFASPTP
jgi:sterol 14-demethylase